MKKTIYGVLGAASLIMTMAAPAHAISYRFKFKVTSSGPDMYACNAGLMNQDIRKTICYKENNDGSKTPVDVNETCSTTGTNCNSRLKCVSFGSSSSGGGSIYHSSFTSDYTDYKDHSDTTNLPVTKYRGDAGIGSVNSMFTDSVAFNKSISNVLFDLNNEIYNAKYFIDICFRAPQTNATSNGFTFNHLTNVGSTDFLSIGETHGDNDRTGIQMMSPTEGRRYTQLSGLKVQTFTVCDIKGSGAYTAGPNASGVYNTSDNEANFIVGSDGVTPTGAVAGSVLTAQSSLTPVPGAGQDVSSGSVAAPRFCKVRYVFTETNAASSLPMFRDWTRKGAEMCTYTEFNDPGNNSSASVMSN